MKKGKIKIIFCFTLAIFILFLASGVGFYWQFSQVKRSGRQLVLDIFSDNSQAFKKNYRLWRNNFGSLRKSIAFLNKITGNFLEKKFRMNQYLSLAEKINVFLPEITGMNGQRVYFVLLQNNRELRPTGGFMGSYAKLKFSDGGLNKVIFQDIYVPDGQIEGHVEPPWPIQEAFKHGFWKLRDANFDPDFSKASEVIGWFLEKGKEEKADGILAVNLITIEKLVKVLGPVFLSDYNQTVGVDNFYQILQSGSETDFFPGSTQKADIITAAGKALFEKLKKPDTKKVLLLGKVILDDLQQRQILIYSTNYSLARFLNQEGWDGTINKIINSDQNNFYDFFYPVETNLGANKANCCLERDFRQTVSFGKERYTGNLEFNFRNNGLYEEGRPPFFWGGTYVNFFRVYLPAKAKILRVFNGDIEVPENKLWRELREDLNLQSIGFFIKVPTQKEKKAVVEYEIPLDFPLNQNFNYRLFVQKQPGIESFPYILKVNQRKETIELAKKKIYKDEEIVLRVEYNR